jgi:hypothetical protein
MLLTRSTGSKGCSKLATCVLSLQRKSWEPVKSIKEQNKHKVHRTMKPMGIDALERIRKLKG